MASGPPFTEKSPRPRHPLPEIISELQTPPLDDIPGEKPTTKRRRVDSMLSNACEPCRKRKSKCDGVQPSCTACVDVHDTECFYDPDNDARRRSTFRKEIGEFKGQKEGKHVILDAIKTGSEADVDDIVQLIRTNPDEPYELIAEAIQKMSLNSFKKSKIPSLERELAEFSEPTDKASKIQHHGYSSHLTSEGPEGGPVIDMEHLGNWTTVTTDGELVKHLLSLYFAWSHPFYLLFPEEVFWHGWIHKKTKYCSPMLANAVLALACSFSNRAEAREDPADPTTAGEHFFNEAKRLLAEDGQSCLTSVQALGVMSLRQAMHNHDSNAWSFSGRMMNMAVELGLHMTYKGPPDGQFSATEIEVRRITFWGCYVLETLGAICVGRISSLPRTAIRLHKPFLMDNLELKLWKPYGDPRDDVTLYFLEQPSYTYNLLVQSSLLSEIVNDMVHMFYAPRERITSRKLQQHHDRLQNWHKGLHPFLQINEKGTLPQVLALHIYYHNCVHHLFRPFLRLTFKEHATKTPRIICTEAAGKISQLLRTYKIVYGLRRPCFVMTHCAISAAIIHLLNMSSQSPDPMTTIQASKYLLEVIAMLQDMQCAFPVAARYLQVIRNLAKKWDVDLPGSVQQAMITGDFPTPVSSNGNLVIDLKQITPPTFYSDADLPSLILESREDSASEHLQTPSGDPGLSTAGGQQFFSAALPEGIKGLLVDPPDVPTSNFDFGMMLAADGDSEWGQFGRDDDFSSPLQGINWDKFD